VDARLLNRAFGNQQTHATVTIMTLTTSMIGCMQTPFDTYLTLSY